MLIEFYFIQTLLKFFLSYPGINSKTASQKHLFLLTFACSFSLFVPACVPKAAVCRTLPRSTPIWVVDTQTALLGRRRRNTGAPLPRIPPNSLKISPGAPHPRIPPNAIEFEVYLQSEASRRRTQSKHPLIRSARIKMQSFSWMAFPN